MKRLINFIFCLGVVIANGQAYQSWSEAVEFSGKVEELDLSCDPVDIHSASVSFPQLKRLSLTNMGLTKPPDWLVNSKQLEYLDVSQNMMLNFAEWIKVLAQLPELKELNISYCGLLYLPQEIADLKELQKLSVRANGLYALPTSIRKLGKLSHLDLADNLLSHLPVDILHCDQLKSVDLSGMIHTDWNHNFRILSGLPELRNVRLERLDTLTPDIKWLSQIDTLSFRHSSFYTLSDSISKLGSLKQLDISDCPNLDMGKAIESFTSLNLQELVLGGSYFKNLLYNIAKLNSVRSIVIRNSHFERIPSSVGRMRKLKKLTFESCIFPHADRTMTQLARLNRIDRLSFRHCGYDFLQQLDFSQLSSLRTLDVRDNGLFQIPASVYNSSIPVIDLRNNLIDNQEIARFKRSYSGKVMADKDRYVLMKITAKSQERKIVQPFKDFEPTPYRVIIYPIVGRVVELGTGTRLDIPPDAFVDGEGNLVKEDVELSVMEFNSAQQLFFSGLPLISAETGKPLGFHSAGILRIQAFCEGKEVFINPEKPIEVQLATRISDPDHRVYRMDESQGGFVREAGQQNIVPYSVLFSDISYRGFSEMIYRDQKNIPKREDPAQKSRVNIRLKKYNSKRSFYFLLEPEYGFDDKYMGLMGGNVKGYPEFKPYEGYKWYYKGEDEKLDFEKVYMLADNADQKRFEQRSAFYNYMLQLHDIKLYPDMEKDHYWMEFTRGYDTLRVPVLPRLPVVAADKAVKWHKTKYEKYIQLRSKRQERWGKIEERDSVSLGLHQDALAEYRRSLVNRWEKRYKDQLNCHHTYRIRRHFQVHQTGYWACGRPLTWKNQQKIQLPKEIQGKKSWLCNDSKLCVLSIDGQEVSVGGEGGYFLITKINNKEVWVTSLSTKGGASKVIAKLDIQQFLENPDLVRTMLKTQKYE